MVAHQIIIRALKFGNFRLNIFYGTQASTKPPTFVIFVNNKDLFHFSYERYLVNQIRSNFGLQGTPIRVIVREKGDE